MHADNECRPAQGAHRDRAATVATAVIAIIVHALRDRLVDAAVDLHKARAAIETYLRDEFDDLARQVRGERDVIDP
jgi:hypothetical protein